MFNSWFILDKIIIVIIVIVIVIIIIIITYLFQRLSVALQRGNAVSYHSTFTTE